MSYLFDEVQLWQQAGCSQLHLLVAVPGCVQVHYPETGVVIAPRVNTPRQQQSRLSSKHVQVAERLQVVPTDLMRIEISSLKNSLEKYLISLKNTKLLSKRQGMQ